MSFVNVTPDFISQAAGDLAGIGSSLGEANVAAALSTTGVLAPGLDEVSVAITTLLGTHAQEYQALSAQAANFHNQFVSLLNSGAGQYLNTEVANAQQALAGAVGDCLGFGGGSSGPGAAGTWGGAELGGAVAQGVATDVNALLAGLPNLSMTGSALSTTGQAFINGATTVVNTLATNASGVFTSLGAVPRVTCGSLLDRVTSLFDGTGFGAAAVASPFEGVFGDGPYQNLVANTGANLQLIQNDFVQQTAPLLIQAATNPFGAPQAALTALRTGNVGPLLSLPGQIAAGSAELTQQLSVPVSISSVSVQNGTASIGLGLGLQQQLAFSALGAPVTGSIAAGQSAAAVADAMAAGNTGAALSALVAAPANIADGFLNGQATLSLDLALPGGLGSATAQVPFSGLLVPLQPFSVSMTVPGLPFVNTVTVTGPPVGGLVPALVNYAPQQLAGSIQAA
ncbi:MAG: PE family protein [Mycobacteriaceae bacterium]|nr:PE family protein [Mycobacteriaceae bacterium]